MAPDSVGLAAYTIDSHKTQCFVKNGEMALEGWLAVDVPKAYPISYRSLIPKSGECENLLVPSCVSASHVAFGLIRMEPVVHDTRRGFRDGCGHGDQRRCQRPAAIL